MNKFSTELSNLAGHGATAGGKLRIFSMHLDYPAAMRARWAANAIIRQAGTQWAYVSEMWKLDSLQTSAAVRKMITEEAAQADVILIAVSSLNRRELELIEWLESLPPSLAGEQPPGLLIGLFGDESQQTRELDWTVKRCMQCAGEANRDFIWHWMEDPLSGTPEWLTSHLATFLSRKLSAEEHHFFLEPAGEFA